MNIKQKKAQLALDANVSFIERASGFIVVFKYAPKQTFEEIADTFETAKIIAENMNKSDLGEFGKRAAIYALVDDVRYIVT